MHSCQGIAQATWTLKMLKDWESKRTVQFSHSKLNSSSNLLARLLHCDVCRPTRMMYLTTSGWVVAVNVYGNSLIVDQTISRRRNVRCALPRPIPLPSFCWHLWRWTETLLRHDRPEEAETWERPKKQQACKTEWVEMVMCTGRIGQCARADRPWAYCSALPCQG